MSEHKVTLSQDRSVFELAERAMKGESISSGLAMHSDSWPKGVSQDLRDLSVVDNRFKDWPADFERAHRIAHILPRYYDENYWRLNAGMPFAEVNPSLEEDERDVVAHLLGMILMTRVRLEETGNTVYPFAPTLDNILDEQRQVHSELNGDPAEYDKFSNLTLNSTIAAMIDGEMRIGLPNENV